MKTVVVTGGAGFVGSNLVGSLTSRGDTVISLDNYSSNSKIYVDGCHYFCCDLSQNPDLSHLDRFGRPDCVFHMAATARIPPSFLYPDKYWRNNCDSTFYIANQAVAWGCPVIYAGSSSHHQGKFKNPYTFTKDVGEDIMKMYGECFGLRYSTARFYNVYGPGECTDDDYSTLIGRWRRLYELGLPFVINGDGSKTRDFTHVFDVVDALLKIMDLGAYGHSFEIGRGDPKSVMDIMGFFGREEALMRTEIKGEAQHSVCDNKTTKSVLCWNPTRNVKDYIENIVDGKKTK
jgi:UDP-glucose 4-epimerase